MVDSAVALAELLTHWQQDETVWVFWRAARCEWPADRTSEDQKSHPNLAFRAVR